MLVLLTILLYGIDRNADDCYYDLCVSRQKPKFTKKGRE